MKPHRLQLTIAFVLLALATAADLSGTILLKIFIDDYLTPGVFPTDRIVMLAGLYLLLHMASVGVGYLQLLTFHKIALAVIRDLRISLFNRVQRLSISYFDRTPAGGLVSRITNDTEAIKDLYVSVLSTFVQNAMFMAGVFVAMFILDVKLAALFLLLLPVVLLLMGAYRRLSSKVYYVLRQGLGRINAKLNESLQGMAVIQSMGQEKRFIGEFGDLSQGYYHASMKNIKLGALMLRPAVDIIYLLALITLLSFFGINSFQEQVKIGVLYAFINYIDRLFEPVNMMMMKLSQLQQAVAAAERVFELLDEESGPEDCAENREHKITRGKICFKNVTFSYDGSSEVLKNVSFTADPGRTVALVGHTGSGKSTVANLLLGFYPLGQGEITIDGEPLDSFSRREISKNMALVLQEPFLFAGDINRNIRLGNESMTDEDIREAAVFVQADSFIGQLPMKYQQPVAEGGSDLSTGQRQLITFARAMAINPKILILDEATASIDTETEEQIHTALEKMRRGRTTIAIAHRLSTIKDADMILVFHRGKIVERGTHRDLLSREGLYHKMYLLQQGY